MLRQQTRLDAHRPSADLVATMKNLLACLAVFAAFNVSAQVNGFQLPYNPDVEPDGFIGVSDVLALLPLYGQEFSPNNLHLTPDSTNLAIEVSTDASWFECHSQCATLEGSWRVMTDSDIGKHWELLVDNDFYWVEWPEPPVWDRGVVMHKNVSGYISAADLDESHRCVCTTQERPRHEYLVIDTNYPLYDSEEEMQALLDDKALEGWLMMPAPIARGLRSEFVYLWRWAE